VPPYRQIAEIIKRGILSGQYPPDSRIPTETELVETAITHLRATLLAGQGVVMTIPDEPSDPPKGHKKARRAA